MHHSWLQDDALGASASLRHMRRAKFSRPCGDVVAVGGQAGELEPALCVRDVAGGLVRTQTRENDNRAGDPFATLLIENLSRIVALSGACGICARYLATARSSAPLLSSPSSHVAHGKIDLETLPLYERDTPAQPRESLHRRRSCLHRPVDDRYRHDR